MNDLLKKSSLIAVGWYNILAGIGLVCFPSLLAELGGLPSLHYPLLVQVIGILVGCIGLAFLFAARSPITHWPIVLIGLISKVLAPIFVVYYTSTGALSSNLLWLSFPNDVVWWIPLGLILFEAFETYRRNEEHLNYLHEADLNLNEFKLKTQHGHTLAQMAQYSPVLLVFLRHFGCTFCRETLASLAKDKSRIAEMGTRIVLVHMVDEELAASELDHYGIENIARISDPDKNLYQAFGLHRGSANQLFGWKIWVRALHAGLFKGHLIGKEKGDAYQMPGVFLLQNNQVVRAYRHHSASDTPDYRYLATPQPPEVFSVSA